jgi:23S rRNA A2030 N6-methylase RlmJ
VEFSPASKVEKDSGVWVDGQYIGFVKELQGHRKVLLLPGKHEVLVRSAGYRDFTRTVVLEPGEKVKLAVQLERDDRAQYSDENGTVKLKVTPERAAVFVDDVFVGHASEFGGIGRGLLIAPGNHQIKLALLGYRDYVSVFELKPKQKLTVEAKLVKGSILQADPAIKADSTDNPH